MSDLNAQAFDLIETLRLDDAICYADYSLLYDALAEIPTLKERDEIVETIWRDFEDVPMDPETECMEAAFLHFPVGTKREDIWHWFDERHSQGVHYLLYGAEIDPQKVKKLLELADKSFECETEDCAYNRCGWCRFALVNEKAPEITEEDGCKDGIIDVRR